MIVNTLDLVLEVMDIQRIFEKVTGEVDKLKEISVSLENNALILGGKISIGLTIPFSTKWRASLLNSGNELCLTLAGVSVAMVGMGEDMISCQVLSMLQSKLQGYDAVRVDGEDVIVDLRTALAPRGITLSNPVKKVFISPTGIELEI